MDTLSAFMLGEIHRNDPLMVFDWNKAARLIKKYHPVQAYAGLTGDMENTSGLIYKDGKPVADYYKAIEQTGAQKYLFIPAKKYCINDRGFTIDFQFAFDINSKPEAKK